jgi:hypothetical protein
LSWIHFLPVISLVAAEKLKPGDLTVLKNITELNALIQATDEPILKVIYSGQKIKILEKSKVTMIF